MKITTRLTGLAILLGLTAAHALALMPGYKGSLSLALTVNEEIGAYPATTAQKTALEAKGGTYADPLNPFGYIIPPNGTQLYSFRTTPVGKIIYHSPGITGTYTSEHGFSIKSTPYTNAAFLADAVRSGQLTSLQATGAKLVAVRLAGNYDESRIYLFAEGAKAAPGPFFVGILDDRDLEDSGSPQYYINTNGDTRLMIMGQYGFYGYGRATVGRTTRIKSVLIEDIATHTTVSAGGTTITGISLKFFRNSSNAMGFTVTGPLTIKDSWSSFSATKNTSFKASGLIGTGVLRGTNNTITGSVAITAEVPVADLSRYFNTTGISGGPGGLVITK